MQRISRKTAKTLGLPRYFTGEPCIHGHVSERRVSNQQCTACIRDHNRDVYLANKGRWPKSEEARNRDNKRRRAAHMKERGALLAKRKQARG